MKTGIFIINLGTPDSWKTPAVRRYLKEFLLDERVIDIPAFQRNLLVRGIIAPFRAPKSGATYKEIWTEEGSPLMVYTEKLLVLLREALGEDYQVEMAMRYQNPSIESQIQKFKGKDLDKIRVIALYPQYASATTGSTYQKVMELVSKWQTIPSLEFVNSFHDHPTMIRAWKEIGEKYDHTKYDHILFSYHGLPERQLVKADEGNHCGQSKDCCFRLSAKNRYCYSAQCYDTTYKIAEALDIPKEKYSVSFQSRLGKTPWKEPYTTDVIEKFAKEGKKRVLVFCPAFVSDCLETIFEVAVEYAEEFEEAGGEHLQLVEGLNIHPTWVEALKEIALKQ